ncbi:MAG: hypothetical protein CSA34_02540 [Desulfobulbus propionicus]|nr:MAG: hypothetical protein CSA34_02540 [Desulfobulbus propionicus]
MKKIILVVSLLVVAAVYGSYLLMRSPAVSAPFSSYLPTDTLLTVRMINLNHLTDTFPQTALGHLLAKETMTQVLGGLGAGQKILDEYARLYDQVGEVMGNPAFRQIFGDDAVAALLTPAPDVALEEHFVVFATTSVSAPVEAFARLVMSDTVSREEVDGRSLTRITLEDGSRLYGFAENGLVLLVRNPALINHLLERRAGGEGLDTLPAFIEARRYWAQERGGTGFTELYLGMPALLAWLQGDSRVTEGVHLNLKGMEGVNYLAATIYQDGEDLNMAGRVGYTYEKLSRASRAAVDTATSNTGLNLISSETLLYSWGTSLIPEVFDETVKSLGNDAYNQLDQRVRLELDMGLEQLLAAFGQQFGFAMNGMAPGGFFPLPKLQAYVQVRDAKVSSAVVDRLLEELKKQGPGAGDQLAAGDTTIHYWPLLPGEAAQPALALTADKLLIANGPSALAEYLQHGGAPDALAKPVATALGSDLAGMITGANTWVALCFPRRLSEAAGSLVDWLLGLAASSQEIDAEQAMTELLRLMRSVEAVVAVNSLYHDYAESEIVFRSVSATP